MPRATGPDTGSKQNIVPFRQKRPSLRSILTFRNGFFRFYSALPPNRKRCSHELPTIEVTVTPPLSTEYVCSKLPSPR